MATWCDMRRHAKARGGVAPVLPRREQAVSRTNLTDRFIKSRQPAPAGRRDEYQDAIVPGLALRVTATGHKSFVLIARFPTHPKNPTRRAIGRYGAVGLEDARARARQWLEWIERGVDPAVEEARQAAATHGEKVK